MRSLTPPQIVECLDTHLSGQAGAKRALAVEVRNRWRREQARIYRPDDAAPYRYLVAGPRGVGKSALIRHMAMALDAPFVRVTPVQLLAAGAAERATNLVLESLIESALERAQEADISAAIREVEQAGIILIDRLDHWAISGAEEANDDQAEAALPFLYRMTGAAKHDTRYGPVSSADIMIFATGDITTGRQTDIPSELQLLFPKRFDLDTLNDGDLLHILSKPEMSPINDYVALLATEGLRVHFTQDGIEAIAREADEQNRQGEDIGARRLGLVIEIILDDVLYNSVDTLRPEITIDAAYVSERIAVEADDEDLEDFIL